MELWAFRGGSRLVSSSAKLCADCAQSFEASPHLGGGALGHILDEDTLEHVRDLVVDPANVTGEIGVDDACRGRTARFNSPPSYC